MTYYQDTLYTNKTKTNCGNGLKLKNAFLVKISILVGFYLFFYVTDYISEIFYVNNSSWAENRDLPCTFPLPSPHNNSLPSYCYSALQNNSNDYWKVHNCTNPAKEVVDITCNTTELWVLLVKMRVFPALEECKWEESPISQLPRDSFKCWSSSSTRDLKDVLNEKKRKMKMCIIHSNEIILGR